MGEIAPRFRSAIHRCVRTLGCEDSDELVQDGIAMSAQMLSNVERAGKQVTPGNIACYTILHLKSGRRNTGASRADVMACGTQLDSKSALMSTEEEVGYDPELDEAITLGSLLAVQHEDPATAGGRNVDWDAFLGSHDYRYGVIVAGMLEGESLSETARSSGLSYLTLGEVKVKLADDLREFMRASAVLDALKVPTWRANLVADREKAACKADRRRW